MQSERCVNGLECVLSGKVTGTKSVRANTDTFFLYSFSLRLVKGTDVEPACACRNGLESHSMVSRVLFRKGLRLIEIPAWGGITCIDILEEQKHSRRLLRPWEGLLDHASKSFNASHPSCKDHVHPHNGKTTYTSKIWSRLERQEQLWGGWGEK